MLAQLINITIEAVKLKRQIMDREIRWAIAKSIHTQQFAAFENKLFHVLTPFFQKQLNSIIKNLTDMSPKSKKDIEEFVSLLFNPYEWDEQLIDIVLPILAGAMSDAALAQYLSVGIDPKKITKATSASEWLARNSGDLDEFEELMEESGISTQFATELPLSMKLEITRQLKNTFSQPYWHGINETTSGDAAKFLKEGLAKGWSTRRIASEISRMSPGYSIERATRVARTEIGNALNGARKGALDSIAAELGPQIPVKAIWLSVLGPRTRETHAMLHGVPADAEGMWNLSGISIPWPSHYSLPAKDRANCMCGISQEFGMDDAQALQEIGNYQDSVEAFQNQ